MGQLSCYPKLYSSNNLRRGVSVQQDMPVLQILSIWPHLKVFLDRVAAFEWRNRGILNGRILDLLCHFALIVWSVKR